MTKLTTAALASLLVSLASVPAQAEECPLDTTPYSCSRTLTVRISGTRFVDGVASKANCKKGFPSYSANWQGLSFQFSGLAEECPGIYEDILALTGGASHTIRFDEAAGEVHRTRTVKKGSPKSECAVSGLVAPDPATAWYSISAIDKIDESGPCPVSRHAKGIFSYYYVDAEGRPVQFSGRYKAN